MRYKCPCCGNKIHLSVLATVIPTNGKIVATIEQIAEIVSRKSGISVEEMTQRTRVHEIVKARQQTMWLVRELTDTTLLKIGKYFGMDHSSVIHAVDAIRNMIVVYENEKEEMEVLKAMCYELELKKAS